jgi:hypothetical protein
MPPVPVKFGSLHLEQRWLSMAPTKLDLCKQSRSSVVLQELPDNTQGFDLQSQDHTQEEFQFTSVTLHPWGKGRGNLIVPSALLH